MAPTYRDFLSEIVLKLSLQSSGDGSFYGIRKQEAVILIPLTESPPSFSLKVRISMSNYRGVVWPKSIDELRSSDILATDWDKDYYWLNIFNASKLSAAIVIEIVDDFLGALEKAGLRPEPNCASCNGQLGTQLIYSNRQISWVCSECMSDKLKQATKAEEQLNQTDVTSRLILPLALCMFAFVWAVFWTGYEFVFHILNTREIIVPLFVVILVIIPLALCSAAPVGYLLRKSGATSMLSPLIAAPLFTLIGALLGEIAIVCWVVYRQFGVIDPLSSVMLLPKVMSDYATSVWGYKIFLVILLNIVVFDYCKRKKVEIQL